MLRTSHVRGRRRGGRDGKRPSVIVGRYAEGTVEQLEERRLLAVSLPPAIHGVVYDDFDASGSFTDGEQLSGVSVQLALDNGDGLYLADEDPLVVATVSDADGEYAFDNLATNATYFVVRPSQVIDAISLTFRVSGPIVPGQADVVIDEFGTTQIARVVPPPPSSEGSVLGFSDEAEVIGAERDLQVELLSGQTDVTLLVDGANAGGQLGFEVLPGSIGSRLITWDGVDGQSNAVGAGLAGRDLTAGGQQTGIVLYGGVQGGTDGVTAA